MAKQIKQITVHAGAPAWKRHALASACVIVLAGISTADLAQAAPGAALDVTNATFTNSNTLGTYFSEKYNRELINTQSGLNALDGSVTNSSYGSNLTGPGTVPTSVNNNMLQALASGNQGSGNVGLSLLNNAGATDGILALNLQTLSGGVTQNTFNTLTVSATNTGSSVFLIQAGMSSAALALNGNTISAATTLNTSDTLVSGMTPNGYASPAMGSSMAAFGILGASLGKPATPTAGTTGSVNLSSLQSTFNVDSAASVTGAAVALDVSRSTGGTFSSTANVNNNTVSAAGTSNATTSIFQSDAGSSAFTGSVSVSNVQTTVVNDTGARSLANLDNSSVTADLRNRAQQTDLTGTLTLSGNTLSATVAGNTASSPSATGNMLGGNAIVFNGSSDITGSASGTGSAVAPGTARTAGDLTLLNAQSNFSNTFTAAVGGTGPVNVRSALDNLNGGTLTQSSNKIASTATANLAGNLISAGQSASIGNLNASTSAANVQANSGTTTVMASVENADVTATVGIASATVRGVVTMDQNSIAATAKGNVGVSTVALKAANLSVSGSLSGTQGVAVNPSAGTASAGLGVVAVNVQSNDNTTLTSSNNGNSVALKFADSARQAVGVTGTQATLTSNALTATSTGNSDSTSVSLEGANTPGLSSAVGNSQANTDGAITSTAGFLSPLSVILSAGNVANSPLTVDRNVISAEAKGNVAASSLTVKATTATGAAPLAAVTIAASASDTAVQSLGDLVLANAQRNASNARTDVTAATVGSASIAVGNVSGSSLSLSSNSIGAAADVNSAKNALTLNITDLRGMTAALASGQQVSGSQVSAVTNGTAVITTGLISGVSALAANKNAITASATGNSASNALALTATTAVGSNVASPSSVNNGNGASVAADFALASNQIVSNSTLTSTSTGTVQLNAVTNAVSTSPLTLNDNTVTAITIANNATSELALKVTNLSASSVGLASRQAINTQTVSSESTGGLLIKSGSVNGSALTLSGNVVKAASLGNMATNQLSVASTNATPTSATVTTAASAMAASAMADFAVANLQTNVVNTLAATAIGTAKIDVGAVTAGSNGSALILSGNTVQALTQSNSAVNGLTLGVTNLNGLTAAVASSQSTNGNNVTATAGGNSGASIPAFSILATSVTGTPVVMTGNAVNALASMNEAFNTLTVAGTNLTGRGGAPTTSVVGTAATGLVGFSIVNAQDGVGMVTATAEPGLSGFGSALAPVNLSGGSLTLSNNGVLARASVNTASNLLTLGASSSLNATATVNNVQSMASAVLAQVTAGSSIAATLSPSVSTVVTVDNNSVTAQATGNQAMNALNAVAVSGIGTNGSATNPTFAVLNSQTTNQIGMGVGISAVLNTTNLGTSFSGASSTTTANAQGNQLQAIAYGNSASNAIGMSPLTQGLNTASAAITNVQYNLASISASVTGASVAVSGALSGGSVNVSGNTITAQVVGNRAVNSITAR